MIHRKLAIGTTALLGLVLSTSAFAGQAQVSTSQMQVQPRQSMSNMTLTVSGPNGFHAQKFSASGTPSLSFAGQGALADGTYHWELTGATSQLVAVRSNGLDNGRGANARAFVNKGASETGTFRVINGSVFQPDNRAEATFNGKEK